MLLTEEDGQRPVGLGDVLSSQDLTPSPFRLVCSPSLRAAHSCYDADSDSIASPGPCARFQLAQLVYSS